MKRPNGVIVDTQAVMPGSATVNAISDVPPCKVSECDYFRRDSRAPNDFGDCDAASNLQTDEVVTGCLNGVQSILDDLKDRLLEVASTEEGGCSKVEHHTQNNDAHNDVTSPGNPESPLIAADAIDVDLDGDNCLCRPTQAVVSDEDMTGHNEGESSPDAAGHKEASQSLVPQTNKRMEIERDIKELMIELCRHEAALILLKKIRVSQLIYYGSGDHKFRTTAGSYGRTSIHHSSTEAASINAGRHIGNSENDQNIAPRHYATRTGVDTESRLLHGSFDRQLGQTDRHINHMPGSTNSSSNWTKGVAVQGRNGTIQQTTQRFNSHQQGSSRGIAGCINQGHHTMDRSIQLRSILTENVQHTVDDFLDTFRSYTDHSLSAKINKPLPDIVQSEQNTTSSFLAFMPNNAVNFIPSTVNPEFTMLIGLEVICNRLENRLFISRQNYDRTKLGTTEGSVGSASPDANCESSASRDNSHDTLVKSAESFKDGKQVVPINRCSKCKTYSSPYFFDLTDSTLDHGISDLKALKYPLCCGNCLRALRLEQLTNSQFRKYQDILDNHKAMEKNSEIAMPIKQMRISAEKRPAERRQEEYKYKTRSPQTYHNNPSQHNDYGLEASGGMNNHQLQEPGTQSNSLDVKVRPTNVTNNAHSVMSHLPFPPPPHMTPEQFQQCHAEWLRQAALLQSHGGANPGDNLLLGSHFPVGAPPLLSNAVAAAAALAAMTATHCQGAGFMVPPPPINSFPIMSTSTSLENPFNRHEQSTSLSDPLVPAHQSEANNQNHMFDDDCGVALNLTTRSDKNLFRD